MKNFGKLLYIFTVAISIIAFVMLLQKEPIKLPEQIDIDESKYELNYDQQAQKACLTEALYHEARSEGKTGVDAVLSVIHNRKEAKGYPSTYCGVVKQPKQFSYRLELQNKGIGLKPVATKQSDREALEYIEHVSEKAVRNEFEPTLPKRVLHYTTHKINNAWTKTKQVYARIGNHKFMQDRKEQS